MSYALPNNTTLTGLKNLDLRIQNIATYLKSELTWLDYSFGIADRCVEKKNDKDNFYPGVFLSNSVDPFDCMPHDEFNTSFWQVADSIKIDNLSPGDVPMRNIEFSCTVACIFYVDIRKISVSKPFAVTRSEVKQDIFDAFASMYGVDATFNMTEIIDNDFADIYEGYSVTDIDNLKKQLPFYACRVNGILTFTPDCA